MDNSNFTCKNPMYVPLLIEILMYQITKLSENTYNLQMKADGNKQQPNKKTFKLWTLENYFGYNLVQKQLKFNSIKLLAKMGKENFTSALYNLNCLINDNSTAFRISENSPHYKSFLIVQEFL